MDVQGLMCMCVLVLIIGGPSSFPGAEGVDPGVMLNLCLDCLIRLRPRSLIIKNGSGG